MCFCRARLSSRGGRESSGASSLCRVVGKGHATVPCARKTGSAIEPRHVNEVVVNRQTRIIRAVVGIAAPPRSSRRRGRANSLCRTERLASIARNRRPHFELVLTALKGMDTAGAAATEASATAACPLNHTPRYTRHSLLVDAPRYVINARSRHFSKRTRSRPALVGIVGDEHIAAGPGSGGAPPT